jgi:hypothetical protein
MLSRGKQVRRVRKVQHDVASLRREVASLSTGSSRIGRCALFVSLVAIVLASVAITTGSRHARTYVNIAVAVTVLASFAAVLMYVTRLETRLPQAGEGGAPRVLSLSWRSIAALSLTLALGATLALTLGAEGLLKLGVEGERGEPGPMGEPGVPGQPGHTVTLHQTTTVDRTVTIDKTATIDRTVTLNRTIYLTPTLPPTR